MYSPDGFASLACAMHGQCNFLIYQQPFIQLMHLINGNIFLFYGFQALIWFVLVGLIYFLAKALNLKHLLLTPLILLYSTSFFVDNFIGSFENDCIGIILLLISFICFARYKQYKTRGYAIIGSIFVMLSFNYWLWIGHLGHLPTIYSRVVEEMFWTHWIGWLFLFPIIIMALVQAIKYKNKTSIFLITLILFYPKLFMLIIPILLKFIDEILDKMLLEKNKKFFIMLIICGLIIGQAARVEINTFQSYTRTIEDINCVTVNNEYFLRATKGINYSYNQLDIEGIEQCKNKT